MVKDLGVTWEAVGFQAPDGKVYLFGTDTKVISTVFEAIAAPLIKTIADDRKYIVEGAQQTIYPDFTLSPAPGKRPRIAIDVKTTYREFNKKHETCTFRYTLGSYTSFLRSPGAKKNIRYPYEEYSDHWVIGFLYTRREGVPSKVYNSPKEVSSADCPYQDVEYFIQHKYKVVGESAASGNTANIGSFPTNSIQDLRDGKGPFAALGKDMCDAYWRDYAPKAKERKSRYSNIKEFLIWRTNHVKEIGK
jgi:hypothetical protein